MIASVHGLITRKSTTDLIVEVHGIGYEVFVPLCTFYRLPEEKEQVFLHIHTHVREDAFQLFGFLSRHEKSLFLLLLGVSGVGPKLALNILSGIDPNELVAALREGRVHTLKAIPGVGPKMAGRLALELKEKVAQLDSAGVKPPEEIDSSDDALREDALSALVNLGYHRSEVNRILDQMITVHDSDHSAEDLIKECLKHLAKVK
ncbi:MAG: Holliday junction branch migration protein RuvA [Nitrospiria bacterium]